MRCKRWETASVIAFVHTVMLGLALALWITYAVLYQEDEGGEFPTFSTLLEQEGPLKPLFCGWIGVFFIDRVVFSYVALELDRLPEDPDEPRHQVIWAMDALFKAATLMFLFSTVVEFVGLCGVVAFNVSENEDAHYVMAGMFFGGAAIVVFLLFLRRVAVARLGAPAYGALVWEKPTKEQLIRGYGREDERTWFSPGFPFYLNILWVVVVVVVFVLLVVFRSGAAELVFVVVAHIDSFWQVMDYRFRAFEMEDEWEEEEEWAENSLMARLNA